MLKKLLYTSVFCMSCMHYSQSSRAEDGAISGGGFPPSPFERSRTAIVTILQDAKVRAAFGNPTDFSNGEIVSIAPKAFGSDIYVVTNNKCALEVQFIAKCGPVCVFSTELLNSCE